MYCLFIYLTAYSLIYLIFIYLVNIYKIHLLIFTSSLTYFNTDFILYFSHSYTYCSGVIYFFTYSVIKLSNYLTVYSII